VCVNLPKIFFVPATLTVNDITRAIEDFAPLSLQESYDNAGLITGSPEKKVTKALLTLDATEEVVQEAIKLKAQMIIAHHPIVFGGLKKFNGKNYVERAVIKAIKNDIAIYAAHTNLDNVKQGVNHIIANKLGLQNQQVLRPMNNQLYRLHTYITKNEAEPLMKALFDAGGGNIGNYDECSFRVEGVGTFRGNDISSPKFGKKGVRENAEEVKIEVIFPAWRKNQILKALRDGHYYEEIAYEIYPTLNVLQDVGSGMMGELRKPMKATDFLALVKRQMQTPLIKHTNLIKKEVQKVGVCGGAGFFLLPDAIASGADVFITSDIKYHQFFDADGKIVLTDIGHFESEHFTVELFNGILKKKFPTFATHFSTTITNPVNYYK
jgi:dinuclear metal center YbgI/SA1388 family protein